MLPAWWLKMLPMYHKIEFCNLSGILVENFTRSKSPFLIQLHPGRCGSDLSWQLHYNDVIIVQLYHDGQGRIQEFQNWGRGRIFVVWGLFWYFWLRGHKSEAVSLLVSVSLFLYIFFYRKWDWDQKWDHLTFMAPEPDVHWMCPCMLLVLMSRSSRVLKLSVLTQSRFNSQRDSIFLCWFQCLIQYLQ